MKKAFTFHFFFFGHFSYFPLVYPATDISCQSKCVCSYTTHTKSCRGNMKRVKRRDRGSTKCINRRIKLSRHKIMKDTSIIILILSRICSKLTVYLSLIVLLISINGILCERCHRLQGKQTVESKKNEKPLSLKMTSF